MLSSEDKKRISELFMSIKKDDEFEVMFNNYSSKNPLPFIDFMNVSKYIKYKSEIDKKKLYETIILDIFYNGYRVSITGIDTINDFLGLVYQQDNNDIMSTVITQYITKEHYKLIKKEKEQSNKIDIDTMDIRFRKSSETNVNDKKILEMLSNISPDESDKILYRYKQRLTLELETDLLIDLTIVMSSNNISKLTTVPKIYEIEIDYSPIKFNKQTAQSVLETILLETNMIKKVMKGNDIILTKENEHKILEKYKILTSGNSNDESTVLYSSQPISAEIQHVVDHLGGKSVTDKADGDKYQLFIYEGESYLISNNLNIKKLDKKIKGMDNSIIEGELISYIEKNQRCFLFMMFDCLFYKGSDFRNNIMLRERLAPLQDIAISYGVTPYKIKDYDGPFDLINIKQHYVESIKEFYNSLNKELVKTKINDTLFYPKIFLFPTGGSPSESFLFSDIIWLNCTKNANINCPYVLDGIIFTPMEQKYTKERKEQRYPTFKLKPPETNSLDVYITFEKNKETNGYMDIYDNTIQNVLPFKTYRLINLFVGDTINGKEQPSPFMPEALNHVIYLPVGDNNNIYDVEGNLVQDNTVVEIIYKNNPQIPHPYRWTILKTRWDKTESVIRHKKRYGNYKDVAIKIWKSMTDAVTIEEIKVLSNSKTYDQQMKLLRSRVDGSIITSDRKQDIYYQKVTNLAKKMRGFHNWLKSIIINTYCSPIESENGKQTKQSLLDIGCGRGGDLPKMYHARVGDYVGVDIDFEGIYSATDGAISRYNFLKSKFPDFGKVTYIQADAGVHFTSEAQQKIIPNLSTDNKNTIDRIFTKNKKFDIISSQMAIHYMFANKVSINNLVDNIKNYLKKDGYILLTLFDGDMVHKSFDENNKITSTYTDKNGKRNILYEIIKKYNGDLLHSTGQPVDIHMSWISEEGKYIEEYLVTRELMEKTMKQAGCRLVDTDLFANLYQLNKMYFTNVIKYEENPKNKRFYENIAEFYEDLTGADKESKHYSFLFRYYIFQKIE